MFWLLFFYNNLFQEGTVMPIFADFLAFTDSPGKFSPPSEGMRNSLDWAHVTVAPPLPPEKQTIKCIEQSWRKVVMEICDAHGVIPVTVRDMLDKPGIKFLLGLQHPPIDGTAKELRDMGISVTTIAYGDRNLYGSGFNGPQGKLTDSGKEFLRGCAEFGVILDLAHAGHQTALDILNFSDQHLPQLKVVATHTGCHAVYPHNRNLPDEILKGITRNRDGIVGLYGITFLLHETDNSTAPFVDHLGHMLEVCAPYRVVIGSDGVYKEQNYFFGNAGSEFERMKKLFDPDGRLGMRLPPEPHKFNTPFKMNAIYGLIETNFGSDLAFQICGKTLFEYLYRVLPRGVCHLPSIFSQ